MRYTAPQLLSKLLGLILLLTFLTPAAQAQYFGRNKVQWESFNFKVLKTQHFDIYYYDREKDVVNDVGRMAERWYGRLSNVFQHEFDRKPIVLYANAADFQQTTTTFEMIGQGTGGFTDPIQNRIVMPLTGDYAENDHVLGHEMVHVFQFDIANRIASGNNNGRTRRRFDIEAMPLWVVEGMAEYFSKGRIDPLTAMWIRDSAARKKLPDLRRLTNDPHYFPYRYGQALFAYIGGRFGDDAVIRYFLAAGEMGTEAAFSRALGVTSKQLFNEWHESADEAYGPIIAAHPPTATPGKLLAANKVRGGLNISPSYSPDGRYVALLSTRELFSIDLFLVDTSDGRFRKLISSDSNPHFDALRFIDSAGTWSPDSKKLAFVVQERGDNALAIIDAGSGSIERLNIPRIDSMSNPAWSPDGTMIAFSGQSTGVTDLYVYNLNSKEVRQLTNDKYADLQPAWSPDSRTIAFSSDRGGNTNIEQLRFDQPQISTIDVASGTVTTLRLFDNGKHIDAQYAPDGRSLFFVANPDGISNIYRYEFATSALRKVTDVSTGVSGITDLAPAMSVAQRSGEIAFSVYEKDDYNVYTLPANSPVTAAAQHVGSDAPLASLLPPLRATSATSFTSYLQRPEQGLLPADTLFPTTKYKSNLHLTYIGPPTIGVGIGQVGGVGVGGSLSAYFSDVLGYHNFGFTLQGGGSTGSGGGNFADQIGGEVEYLNQRHRINYGASASHIPYVSAETATGQEVITINNQQILADVLVQRRDVQTFDDLTLRTQYPLSLTRRFEANGGFERIAFKSELEKLIYVNGQLVDDHTTRLGDSIGISLFRAAVAYVGDNSTFGFISPIRGSRYRFEAQQLGGDLNFQTALADYRKYWLMAPVTLAVRGLHYGRYGTDAESNQLSPLFLGQQSLVRGYSIDSFGIDECVAPANSNACPAFDRLLGSKIALASAEIRVPLSGARGYGLLKSGGLPVELAGFVDGGAAWNSGDTPKLQFKQNSNERIPVFSAGIAARILLSYIPLEVYYAHPFQRPEQGGVFGFNISPGW